MCMMEPMVMYCMTQRDVHRNQPESARERTIWGEREGETKRGRRLSIAKAKDHFYLFEDEQEQKK